MALYRLPFPEEDGQTWFVNNGGWDQGGHAAGQGDDNPTDEQAYAFDIDHDTGGKVLAARAGTVIWLDEQWPDDSASSGHARCRVRATSSGSDTATGRWRGTVT